ncbi:MAG: 50S ribosomal protein L25 [Treponema sp.]|nr:50S ribosomal protein L25 [Treponema sp.]
MSNLVLQANSRQSGGSSVARRMRKAGRVPAVIYGRSGKSLSIDLDALTLANGLKSISESTIVKVQVEGKSYEVFVKDTQRNIIDGAILHADFYEVQSDVSVRARVPINLKGNPVGVREGGVLEFPIQQIEVEALPKDLPQRIELDISGLGLSQSILVKNISLSSAVKVLAPAEQVVVLVKYAKGASAAAAATDAAAAAPAAKA